jgi:tRNA threonylcarbamoyladenosine biosynthesis protein TsaB
VIVLGLDTATPSTAVALIRAGGETFERRDDPAPGERPSHASRLLELVEAVLADSGTGWTEIERLAVGVGPGGFTGLRIGIATARALAQARALALVGVSSLQALALGTTHPLVVGAIDARRGEVFAAAWHEGREVLNPAARAPEGLAEHCRRLGGEGAQTPMAVGDGAIRFRAWLEAAGVVVPADDSPLHRLSAAHICRLAAEAPEPSAENILPDYCRVPDAERALHRPPVQ